MWYTITWGHYSIWHHVDMIEQDKSRVLQDTVSIIKPVIRLEYVLWLQSALFTNNGMSRGHLQGSPPGVALITEHTEYQ